MDSERTRLRMVVASCRPVARDIREFTLRPADPAEAPLPPFEPGAHVTVQTPSGAMRRYSLVNDGTAPQEYVIAVKREPGSRGGSASMHDAVEAGTELLVEPPENEFRLVPAPRYLLIAGGIGVTPILSMAEHLHRAGSPFTLIYCTRTADEAAYLDRLRAFPGAVIHHDEGKPEGFYDFWDHFETPPANTHVYCCGPAPLMEEIKALSGHWPEGRVHFEDFAGVAAVRPDDRPFHVTAQRSGLEIDVPADRSLLEAAREAGIPTVSSCESGTCGACKTRLISGRADHRDMVLRDDEKDDYIMICVSRAAEGDLVVDL